MKKFSIFLLGALGMLAATSCEEKIDPATPQANPQEPILTSGDVVSEKAGVLASTAVLSLENYRADGSMIPVMKLVESKDLPEGAVVSYKLQLSDTEDFKREVTLVASKGADDVFSVSASEWNEAHLYLFGKSPKQKTMYYRVPVYVNLDGSDYRLNSADYYAAQGTIVETCMDAGFTISSAYYFLSDATAWALGDATVMDAFKFEHSDADVYDDPVFTFKFKVTPEMFLNDDGTSKDGIYWKIASQEGMDLADWATGIFGPETNGDDNLAGVLVDVNAQAGKLVEAGNYKLTINMEEMTYDFELLLQPEVLYTPGGANGWNQLASAWLKFTPEKAGYYGLTPVDGAGFKVCADTKWDNSTDYGAETDAPALTGTFVLGQEGKNLMVPAAGLYWIKVNYDALTYALTTYELTEVTTVGLIGSFPASAWGSDVLMTSADNGATWTAEVTFDAGNEFKFRFNGDWAYNFGGDLSNLTFDAGNISVAEAGTYTVTLNLLGNYPNATLVKK